MTQIKIRLSRNIGFYHNMPVYLSVYKQVDTYDLDKLSNAVVNRLTVGERTKVITIEEGKEAFDARVAAMRKEVIDALTEKHSKQDAKSESAAVTTPVVEDTVSEEKVVESPVVTEDNNTSNTETEDTAKKTTTRKTTAKKVVNTTEVKE